MGNKTNKTSLGDLKRQNDKMVDHIWPKYIVKKRCKDIWKVTEDDDRPNCTRDYSSEDRKFYQRHVICTELMY